MRAGDVVTVVARRGERVLLVAQPQGGLGLPGGKRRPRERAAAAAARELAEETGIVVAPVRLRDLGLRLPGRGPARLHPFTLDGEPPAPTGPGELAVRWVTTGRLTGLDLAGDLLPGVTRSLHAALAASGEPAHVGPALGRWWARERRELPWRATRDPYAILVAEVMSHQTQVERASAYWARWMARWPTVAALAHASLAEVLEAWQGLGYPRRARDLHAAARRVARDGWPAPERLADLPGVGPYTAAAVRCFAYEEPVLPRDANIERVLARRFPQGVEVGRDPWTLGQALMELGQRVCTSRPACGRCPLRRGCLAAPVQDWDPATRPRRQARYAGSLRARRGRLLRSVLAGVPTTLSADPAAARSLIADGLLRADGPRLAPPL